MRIAQDLSISGVRKAGKSLTVHSAARFTRVDLAGRGSAPTVVTRANVAILFPWVPDSRCRLPLSKPMGSQNGGKMAQKGSKMATFTGTCYVTTYDATPLLPCSCVNCRQKERRETNGHNYLFLKNLSRKHGFPNFQASRQP